MPNKNCEVYFVKVFAQSLTYREQRSGGRHRRYEVICGGTLRGLAVGTGVVRISGVAVTNFQLHRHQFSPSPRNVQLLAHKVKFTQLSEVPQRSAFKTIQFRVINFYQAHHAIVTNLTVHRWQRRKKSKYQNAVYYPRKRTQQWWLITSNCTGDDVVVALGMPFSKNF